MTAPASHPVDRRLAVFIAVIAAVSALLGGAFGGYFSYKSSTDQLNADRSAAQRDVRQTIYSEFLVAADKCDDATGYRYLKDSTDPSAELDALQEQFEEGFDEFRQKYRVVMVVGGSELTSAASKLLGLIVDRWINADDVMNEVPGADSRRSEIDGTKSDIEARFIVAARKELGF